MTLLSKIGLDLSSYFCVSSIRNRMLDKLVCGMLCSGTVNLQEVVNHFEEGSASSNYRNVQRFFANTQLHDDDYIKLIINNLFELEESFTLAIDRTEWSYGKTWHNLLIVSVLYGNSAVPLMIKPLCRKGNSSTEQRIEVMEHILKNIPAHRIDALLGDREFIGDNWFGYLSDKAVSFVMRIRDNITVYAHGKCQEIQELPDDFQDIVHIGTRQFRLCKKKLTTDNLNIVSFGLLKPLEFYRKRWGIETGFLHLKTRGFNLEDTHLTEANRVKLLTQIASMALMTAIKVAVIIKPEECLSKKNTDITSYHSF